MRPAAPVAGSMRWWSRPPGPNRRVSRPEVATPPPVSSRVPATRPGCRGSAMSTRHGPPSGGVPQTPMSPPRSTSAPVSEGQAARIAASARVAANPLPMPPRSMPAPGSRRARPGAASTSKRAPACQPSSGSRRPRGEQLERAVVAGCRKRGKDRRIEPPAGLRSRPQRRLERLDEPLVDRDPGAAGAVQPGEIALRIEAREGPLARLHLVPPRPRARGRRETRRPARR